MRTRKNIKIHVICITLAAISFVLAGAYLIKGKVSNAADTAYVTMEPDMVLTKFDVNGDGKPDNVKYTIVYSNNELDDSATMQVFVNGKVAFKQKRDFGPGWSVNLIKLENGKVFFEIGSSVGSDDDIIHQLYLCKDNKLKSVYNFQKYFYNYADYHIVNIVKISGNTLKLEVYSQFYTTGSVRYNMSISYKDGVFKRTSNTLTLDYKKMDRKNKWTVAKKIKVYKKAGSKKVAFTLKKKDIVKINKVILKKNKVYIQVKKSNGKTGYIPAAKKYNGSYFKEAQYAG